ncbi:MAG: hypothetical protein ACKO2N_22755 [Tabrizicola sp.]
MAETPVGPTGPQLSVVGQFPETATLEQKWLISPGGGLIPRDTARGWLKQDGVVTGRSVSIEFTAPRSALLEEGQVLHDLAHRQAFADIRAKKLAQELCAPLVSGLASACAVAEVVMEKSSLDAPGDTATFFDHALAAVKAICAIKAGHCRIQSMRFDWTSPDEASVSAVVAWLKPLPKGGYPAPPLN